MSYNTKRQLSKIITTLKENIVHCFQLPLCESVIKKHGKEPFLVLVACLLSLRAKDSATMHVCNDLFKVAQTPEEILSLSTQILEKIIYPIGFYRNKAKTLKTVSTTILEKYSGTVPKDREELLKIKGIGPKTANLVLGLVYNIPAICVDIHVHRISNRLGLVKTKTPVETEKALEKVLPERYWIEWNGLLVIWGQNICTPISPFCSKCAIKPYCKQVNVIKTR
ncbi:endonuclease III [Candidatus Babeliales bacterium]|nr:endonuclease III [Candidatus Babeliales bacterium]